MNLHDDDYEQNGTKDSEVVKTDNVIDGGAISKILFENF